MLDVIKEYCAGGIVYNDGRVLTIKIASNKEIIFPKGHIWPEESHQDTAIREVFEETGYKTKIIAPLDSLSYEFDKNDKHHEKIVYYYLMELLDKSVKPTPKREVGEDFVNLWLSTADALKLLTHQNSKDLLKKTLEIINSKNSGSIQQKITI